MQIAVSSNHYKHMQCIMYSHVKNKRAFFKCRVLFKVRIIRCRTRTQIIYLHIGMYMYLPWTQLQTHICMYNYIINKNGGGGACGKYKIIILAHRGAQLLFTYIHIYTQLVRARAVLFDHFIGRARAEKHAWTTRLKLKEEDEKKAICLYISKL